MRHVVAARVESVMTSHSHRWCRRFRSAFVLLAASAWLLGQPSSAIGQQGWSGTVTTVSPALPMSPGPLRIAAHPSGDVVVVWFQSGWVRSTRYVAADRAWRDAVSLGTASGTFYAVPAIALDGAGNAIAVWTGMNAIVAARYSATAGAWGPVATLATAVYPGDPRVAVDASGNALVVWGDSGRIKIVRFLAGSQTWGPPVEIADGYLPQIAVDQAGNAIVLSVRGTVDAQAVRAMRYSASSGTWGSAIDLVPMRQLIDTPQIGFDVAGNAIAMWAGTTGSTFLVQTTRYAVATEEWGTPTTLGPAAGPTLGGVELAVAPAGDAVVAWSASGGVARASRYHASTGTWSSPADVSQPGVGAAVFDVALDARGSATAVWTEADRSVHAARNTTSSTSWSVPATISTPGVVTFFPQVATDGMGNATVAWGTGSSPCPPACSGFVQSTRWSAAPGRPRITGVIPSQGALEIHFLPPVTSEPILAVTNYASSLDNGATWTTRDPASTDPSIRVSGLVDAQTYTARVRAINAAGEGLPSAPVTAIPGPVPGPPIDLTAISIVGNTLTIAWTPPPGGLAPTGYLLEGGVSPGDVLASIPTGSLAPVFTLVAPTGAFYIRVVAVAGAVRGAPSNEIRIFVNVPALPSAPTNLLGLVNGSDIALSWTNTFAGGAPTSLWLSVIGAITTTLPLPMGEGFTYANVPPGTYTLSVVAANASGPSPPSDPVRLTFPATCSGVPGPPERLQTWKLGGTIFLSWGPPAGGTAVASYTVWASGSYEGSFTTTGRTLSGAAAPGSYVLSVTANNACGVGPATATQTVVIP